MLIENRKEEDEEEAEEKEPEREEKKEIHTVTAHKRQPIVCECVICDHQCQHVTIYLQRILLLMIDLVKFGNQKRCV